MQKDIEKDIERSWPVRGPRETPRQEGDPNDYIVRSPLNPLIVEGDTWFHLHYESEEDAQSRRLFDPRICAHMRNGENCSCPRERIHIEIDPSGINHVWPARRRGEDRVRHPEWAEYWRKELRGDG